jgi:PEP-CTERM motif
MRRLIALFLLWPAFVSAQETLVITNGTVTADFADNTVIFNATGSDFSLSGGFSISPDNNPASFPQPLGPFSLGLFGSDLNDGLDIALTLNGVMLDIPENGLGAASTLFASGGVIKGPGTFFGAFELIGTYVGTPNPSDTDCSQCVNLIFAGEGTASGNVVPYPGSPGFFKVENETLTFTAPEPATFTLFAFGLVGLAMRRKAIAPRLGALLPTIAAKTRSPVG